MRTIAIMGNGPLDHIPNLQPYEDMVDIWIGADRGALTLIENDIIVDYAVGDFDSINDQQRDTMMNKAKDIQTYRIEKDETDLELALEKAITLKPDLIYLFGVTGGRLDHTLSNLQLLHTIVDHDIRGITVDNWNQLELTKQGRYSITENKQYPYISFIPFTKHVKGLSLTGFYYPLSKEHISWGSTRCISNKLLGKVGTLTYEEGRLFVIKSRDVNANGIFG